MLKCPLLLRMSTLELKTNSTEFLESNDFKNLRSVRLDWKPQKNINGYSTLDV